MSLARTYLDFNATAPLRPRSREAMTEALVATGNPSSVHAEGQRARGIVENARREVAALVKADPESVIFTSGATEANATVIGQPRWAAIAVSGVEHVSVLDAAKARGAVCSVLSVDNQGRVDLEELRQWLAKPGEGARLVSVQWANNETGVIQPIRGIAEIVAAGGALLHIDAVQAVGRIEIDLDSVGAAFLTLSSHKIGGPQGVGAIVLGKSGAIRSPLLIGGGQEHRLRAGTENVAGCAGFGAAALDAMSEPSLISRLGDLRDRTEREVCAATPDAVVIGGWAPRLANTSLIALPSLRAETSVIAFDLAGVAVSAGSACSSGKVGRSHVLVAMGLSETLIQSAIRVSLGWSSNDEDVDRFLDAWMLVMRRKCGSQKVA
jgi:cysteine desulfurase